MVMKLKWDLIGDVALVRPIRNLTDSGRAALTQKATELLRPPRINVVAMQETALETAFRTAKVSVLAGEPRLRTVHKEFGLAIHLDIGSVFFSPRMANERARLATQLRHAVKKERCLVLYAGCGGHSLHLAQAGADVVAVEKNPRAVSCLRASIKTNKLPHIDVVEADVEDFLCDEARHFQRIVVPKPFGIPFPRGLSKKVHTDGGALHLYEHERFGEAMAVHTVVDSPRVVNVDRVLASRQTIGPKVHRVCYDIKLGPGQ